MLLMNEKQLKELFRKYKNQTLTHEEEEALFNLLRDPQHVKRLETLLGKLWRDTAHYENEALTLAGKRRIAAVMAKIETPHKQRKGKPSFSWAVAASILLLIGLGTFYKLHDKPMVKEELVHRVEEVRTGYGEKKRIKMPDGTLVYLNVGSVLRYDETYNKSLRTVELIGEAFFEVAKDETKPFMVRSQQLNTHVLGTSFNVKAFEEDENLFVALVSGSIKVNQGSSSSILKPGEKIIYNKVTAENKVLAISEKDYWGVWRNEILAFNGSSFMEVAAMMEKWYNVKIYFENKALKNRRFTGEFNNLPVNKVLNLLSKGSPFSYRIEKDEIYIK